MQKSKITALTSGIISLCIVSSFAFSSAPNKTADEVMIAVDNRYDGESSKQKGVLTLIDKKKNKRIRTTVNWMKKYGEDEKTITQVISPPELSGTTILAYEWDIKTMDDETWLYLPKLRKVKRLATTDKSSYFLGSDFTYSDLSGIDVEDFSYKFSAENNDMEKKGQWVLIAKPRKDIYQKVVDETGYIKMKYWVDKSKLLIVKAQYWLKDGHKIKYYTASNIEKIDEVWVVRKSQMILTQGGRMKHASIFEIREIRFGQEIKDEIFTTYAMERPIN